MQHGAPARGALDEFLAREAARRIGPIIGLGRPDDLGAKPGAFRIYLTHDDWQPELQRLADRATAILMVPGDSSGLSWELEYLARARLLGKLFVVTSPSTDADGIGWKLFAEDLAAAEIRVEIDDPGPYAVVGFSSDATATVLAAPVRTAADVLDATDDWLPGRWHEAAVLTPVTEITGRNEPTISTTRTASVTRRRRRVRTPPARTSTGELTGIAVGRPPRPWDVLPVLLTIAVGTGVFCVLEPTLLEPGLGLIIGAGLLGIVVGPLTVVFFMRLYRYLHEPDVDALLRCGRVPGLVRALWHRDPAVRERAHAALSARTDVATAITLIESADHDTFALATTAAHRILEAADDAAVDALGRALDGVTSEIRFAAYLAA